MVRLYSSMDMSIFHIPFHPNTITPPTETILCPLAVFLF
jgi:hypothetical protein